MTTTTAEVKTGLEGLFQSAETNSGKLKDATRKSQADSAKSEAVGQYARTVRNEHLDAAIGKVQEMVTAGTVTDKSALKVEIDKIIKDSEENKKFDKFKDVKSVEELKKVIADHPDEAKEYYTARAINILANPGKDQTINLNKLLSDIPFKVQDPNTIGTRKSAFVTEMKEILNKFTGDDVKKAALINALEIAANNPEVKDANTMLQIVSENRGQTHDPLNQFLDNGDASTEYHNAVKKLNGEIQISSSTTTNPDVETYINELKIKAAEFLNYENKNILLRTGALKTAVEKKELDVEVSATAGGKTTTKPYKSDIKKSDEELFRDAIRNKFGARIDIKTGEVLTPPESNSCLTFHGFKQGDFIESFEITVDKYVTQRAFAYIGGTQSEKEFKEALEKILKFEGGITIKKASARINTAANNSLFVAPTNLNVTIAQPNTLDTYINNAKKAS